MTKASTYYTHRDDGSLAIQGDWILANYNELERLIEPLGQLVPDTRKVDFSKLEHLDTSGAYLLIKSIGIERLRSELESDETLPAALANLLLAVLDTSEASQEQQASVKKHSRVVLWLDAFGRRVINSYHEALHWLAFLGMVLEALLTTALNPRKWRFTSTVAHIDTSGYQAVPIIFLLNFLVGAVVAFLGATVLEQFGATIFTVHLVGFAFMREFGVLLTAIMIAGRTASAFTAHIGSMRLNEEVDALKVGGVDPINILVLPRVTALLVSLPLLTFIAIAAGIIGGMAVAVLMMDISPRLFVEILIEKVGLRHFLVGMSKAPLFALIIATTACLEGFRVQGSAESLGKHTTRSVVNCIFLVILIDALMAMLYMELGW